MMMTWMTQMTMATTMHHLQAAVNLLQPLRLAFCHSPQRVRAATQTLSVTGVARHKPVTSNSASKTIGLPLLSLGPLPNCFTHFPEQPRPVHHSNLHACFSVKMSQTPGCRLDEAPDLAHYDTQGQLITQTQQLRILLMPFGAGNAPGGAHQFRLLQAEPADMQQATPAPTISAMFVVTTPDYTHDVCLADLPSPTTVQHALREIEDIRHVERRSWFRWLVPAQPQPCKRYATVLAIPSWATETPVLVLDLTGYNGVVFSTPSSIEVRARRPAPTCRPTN